MALRVRCVCVCVCVCGRVWARVGGGGGVGFRGLRGPRSLVHLGFVLLLGAQVQVVQLQELEVAQEHGLDGLALPGQIIPHNPVKKGPVYYRTIIP